MAMDDHVAEMVQIALGRVQEAVAPDVNGRHYLNFVEACADVASLFAPGDYDRLREIKRRVDPQDVFLGNHHIAPAAA